MRRRRGTLIAAAVLLLAGPMAIEFQHRIRYHHWLGYGWHVDFFSHPAPGSFRTRKISGAVQFARIRNLTFSTASIQVCSDFGDVASKELPFAAFRVEASRDGRTWRDLEFQDGLNCGERRQFEKAIRPLESFTSLRGPWSMMAGIREDGWIRFIVYSSFDQTHGIRREFVSPPFQL